VSVFLGIAREPVYSPGKVEQDRAILEAVAQRLSADHTVRVVDADEELDDPTPQTVVLAMCQGPSALERLRRWQKAGVCIVNTPAAIENCHRRRMMAAFERFHIPHPASFLVSTGEANGFPDWAHGSVWLKRGDVHATEADDVVLVHGVDGVCEVLRAFRRRGIADALLQRHVEGGVFKFYAVGGGFFHCLPSAGSASRIRLDEERAMAALAHRAAEALGLEVYGGDCIRDPSGNLWLIDLNDWPSYAACRTRAAEAIAALLDGKTRPKTT
jgi:glutathione synthase/RimK-type ligase-like ATP-grasp enzyme